MELTKMELFKAMNDKHTNLRDCEGMVISPVAYHTHTYQDADGKEHTVLVIKDGKTCRSVLLNGKKLSWLDRQDDLLKLGVWAARLYFTTENVKEVDRILEDYLNPEPFDPGACTRGLYLRGVE